MPTEAAFATWRSPITAASVATASVSLSETRLSGGTLYWVERRPDEGGRSVLVAADAVGVRDVVGAPYDLRSQVHEYGGGVWGLDRGEIWFVNAEDQCLYRLADKDQARRVTVPGPASYADLQVDARRGRCVCVRESRDGGAVRNELVLVAGDGTVAVLHSGHDFYASPRLSPDGKRLAWLTWDHPDMPWDATALWCARLQEDGRLSHVRRLAGDGAESLFQPQWSPHGELFVVSDRSDWWNLYRVGAEELQPLAAQRAEFGLPQWVFAQSTYAFTGAHEILAVASAEGTWRAVRIDLASGRQRWLELPFTHIAAVCAEDGEAAFCAASPVSAATVYRVHADDTVQAQRAAASPWPEAYLSRPQPVTFDTSGGECAHGLYYAPTNPDYAAPRAERPPLLVKCHGGPTGATEAALSPRIQFWTSRGFAVLDVNYRGSTGYGRRYRRRLYGGWGELDVDDCVHGARHLAAQGLADGRRLLISGSSAGGFTVLCALTFRDAFSAGASYYGIGDLTRLLESTHKFESRYLDQLVGPYPQAAERYRARSPLAHAERLRCPVIFLQGLRDKVVPPDQAYAMADAVRAQGLPVALVTFPVERHGFRDANNIRAALEAELYFYGRVFAVEPADALPGVPIDNLPGAAGA